MAFGQKDSYFKKKVLLLVQCLLEAYWCSSLPPYPLLISCGGCIQIENFSRNFGDGLLWLVYHPKNTLTPKTHSHYEHVQIDHTAFPFRRGIAMNSPSSQVCFSNLYLTSAVYYSVSGGHNIGSLAYSYCCRAFCSCTQSALRLGHEYQSRIFGIWSLS
jgi:hypothetical protein